MSEATTRAKPATSAESGPHSNHNNERLRRMKKVRVACERCRYRRIKCDGQVPACGNCTKSGSICIDIDSHNADRRISRGLMTNAFARISWLEDVVRTQLPHINLNSAPDLNVGPPEVAGAAHLEDAEIVTAPHSLNESTQSSSISEHQYESVPIPNETPHVQCIGSQPTVPNHGSKRPVSAIHGPTNRESSVEQDTRSVALDLGLLSLNSDSRQLHYVGSSSGSLFASLVQAGRANSSNSHRSKATISSQEMDDSLRHGHNVSSNLNLVQFDVMRETMNSLYAQLRKDLPPRKECDALCNSFFSQLHPNHPFLHRPSFNRMVDALYVCAATEPRSLLQHNGWPATARAFDYNGEEQVSNGRKLIPIPVHVAAFQLLLVLGIGATLQIRRRLYHHNPEAFFNSALAFSGQIFNSISLPSLQAILLLLVRSLVEPGGTEIWTLTHLAMAHCVDLGLHREIGDNMKFSKAAVEMRRRIFFSVYAFDRSVSTIQGRPFSIGDDFWDVNLPSEDANERNFMNENTFSDVSNDYEYMNYSIHLFKITQLVSKIKVVFYRLSKPSGGNPWPNNLLAIQKQVRSDLEQWVSEVPSVVLLAPAELKLRLTIKLKIHYHGAMCLLHQPSQAIVQSSDQALKICYDNAAERLRLYETLYETGNSIHSWRTVHDMFLAGATVLYCMWISTAVRETVSLPALASICRRCSSLLSVAGEWWPTIRKSKLSLERLASHTIEMLAEKSRPGSTLDTFPAATSFHINPETVENPTDWLPESIEEALASVLNHDHDGQLSNILDSTRYNAFSVGMSNMSDSSNNFDDEFWTNLEGYESNDIQD